MNTIQRLIDKRNFIQQLAGHRGKETADRVWTELGVANRHITRVVEGEMRLTPAIENEIEQCIKRAAAI